MIQTINTHNLQNLDYKLYSEKSTLIKNTNTNNT
jgi:hypothetical protein